MHGVRHRLNRRGGTLALMLLALALVTRALVPAGWMPATGDGQLITLCTGMGVKQMWIADDGTIHDKAPKSEKADQPCAFTGFAAALDKAAAPMLTPPAMAAFASPFPASLVSVGHGLAAPPPPATGPPATA